MRFYEKLPLALLGLAMPDCLQLLLLADGKWSVKLRFTLTCFSSSPLRFLLASAFRLLWVEVMVNAFELSDISVRSLFFLTARTLFLRVPSPFAVLRRFDCMEGEYLGSSLSDVLIYLLSVWPVSTPICRPILHIIKPNGDLDNVSIYGVSVFWSVCLMSSSCLPSLDLSSIMEVPRLLPSVTISNGKSSLNSILRDYVTGVKVTRISRGRPFLVCFLPLLLLFIVEFS